MEVTYLANLDGLSWLPQLLPEWNSKQMSEKIIVGMLCSRTQKFIFSNGFPRLFHDWHMKRAFMMGRREPLKKNLSVGKVIT